MIDESTKRQISIIGLMQVGTVIMGTIANLAFRKPFRVIDIELPFITKFITAFAFYFFIVPVVWVCIALFFVKDDKLSVKQHWIVLASGIIVFGFLFLMFGAAIALPYLGVCGGMLTRWW